MDQLRQFDIEHDRLRRIAVRVLGSATDADDVLQDARLRLLSATQVDDLSAWLTTVVTRLCLDQLRKRANRTIFESMTTAPTMTDTHDDVVLAEHVGKAMDIVLDTLTPPERVAFVLHDVFGYPFDEISVVLGRSITAVRQLASRARRKVQGVPEPTAITSARIEHRQVVDAFLAAARGGDLNTLMSLIAPDAVMRTDTTGQSYGAAAVYESPAAIAARMNGAKGALPMFIDGERGAAWIVAGVVRVAFVFHVDAGLVREVELVADPEVLAMMTITRQLESEPPPTPEKQ